LFDTKEEAEEAAATWRLAELEKGAAELSSKGLTVRIENDQLVANLDHLNRFEKGELDRIMNVEIKKLWSKGEKYTLMSLLIGGVVTIPIMPLSICIFIISFLFWRYVNSIKRDAVLSAYPGVFG